jgi:anti-anti-sigma regulatory factor
VPIQLRVVRGAESAGGIALEGTWPERGEASARLASLGVASAPACAVSAGFTSGWLSGMLDEDVLAVETLCAATGATACCFAARDAETWRASGEPEARAGLDVLPFEALRELVRQRTPAPEAPEEPQGLETSAGVVHIWGPVMIVPWAGPDEALAAIELVGRDPGAREVSVIVLDLSGASLDENFAAVALERIVETVEDRGWELLIAGASPEAESVLAGLDRRPISTHKDLDHAVAAAFQIAEAQRRLL